MGDENKCQEREEPEWTAERLCRSSYNALGSPSEVENRFFQHLLSLPSCRTSLEALLAANSTTTRDFSLEIDAFDLLEEDPVLGHLLLRFPSTLQELLENAIVRAQRELCRQLADNHPESAMAMTVKGDKGRGKGLPATRVHARLIHLPPTCKCGQIRSLLKLLMPLG